MDGRRHRTQESRVELGTLSSVANLCLGDLVPLSHRGGDFRVEESCFLRIYRFSLHFIFVFMYNDNQHTGHHIASSTSSCLTELSAATSNSSQRTMNPRLYLPARHPLMPRHFPTCVNVNRVSLCLKELVMKAPEGISKDILTHPLPLAAASPSAPQT